MKPNFPKKDAKLGVVIISGSCCIPGMAPLDEQALRIVERAVSETGLAAQVEVVPATAAFFGGAPKEVTSELMADFQSGGMPVPAILINGKIVSCGVPNIEDVKAALIRAAGSKKPGEDTHHDN